MGYKRFITKPHLFCYHRRNDDLYQSDTRGKNGEDYFDYYSERYGKWVRVKFRQVRDGATWAIDIVSLGWWVHDQLCADGVWLDGSDVTPRQAAMVLHDILKVEGYWFRKYTWPVMTYLKGCKRARLELEEIEAQRRDKDEI